MYEVLERARLRALRREKIRDLCFTVTLCVAGILAVVGGVGQIYASTLVPVSGC